MVNETTGRDSFQHAEYQATTNPQQEIARYGTTQYIHPNTLFLAKTDQEPP